LSSVSASPRPAGLFLAEAPPLIRRLLLPSFIDCFFIALLVWLFVAGPYGWSALLADGDAGWHIRTGEYILNTHSIPRTDLFSFSRAGQPWFAWEWLSDVVFALIYRTAGLKGIVLFGGVLIASFATLLLRFMVWRGANGLIAAVVCLPAVAASSIHFLARPHLFTLLFFVTALWILEADRLRPRRELWLLVPLTTLWTNLHGGFPVLFILIALFLVGAVAERLGSGREALPAVGRRYGTLLGACLAATLLNPFGIGLHRHIVEYLRSDWIRSVVEEFQAPTFRSENQFQFEMLLLAAALAAGFRLRERRYTDALLVVGFAHLALTSARHIPLFAAAAAPVVALEASALWQRGVGAGKPRSVLAILGAVTRDLSPGFRRVSVAIPVAVALIALVPGMGVWPADFPQQLFPVRMIGAHEEALATGRVLTTDQWGDYLIFRFWPRNRVFVDGRTDFYGPSVGGDYIDLWHGQSRWQRLLDQYRFDAALIPPDWPLCALLRQDPGWKVISTDKQAVLLFRRQPAAAPAIHRSPAALCR
jgi:hypothetical protein